jgi:hypothetical protein
MRSLPNLLLLKIFLWQYVTNTWNNQDYANSQPYNEALPLFAQVLPATLAIVVNWLVKVTVFVLGISIRSYHLLRMTLEHGLFPKV